MNRLAWIVTLPVALLVILFALMNRQEVVVSLWPLPFEKPLPLFALTLGSVLFGFLVGAVATWFSGGTTRQKLRAAKRELADAHDQLAILKRQQAPAETSKAILHRPPTALPPAA